MPQPTPVVRVVDPTAACQEALAALGMIDPVPDPPQDVTDEPPVE
jgi:hypothetical protein